MLRTPETEPLKVVLPTRSCRHCRQSPPDMSGVHCISENSGGVTTSIRTVVYHLTAAAPPPVELYGTAHCIV
ncbi:Os07g0488215 [Oryza sativa Japonica Group]|uniref:Os07g0487198 protein n=1 Tax=Oryza sativa subsp. japonica TaxID=39947 RepID=A0A0P0X5Z8_ORYSJ|nr:hypothetical protein EE612_039285 [Oryza sativa]BAT01531.1 Os07g0487198 [Oryza sativa Japonica Group]BAT01535.1 Os07g0488215 [Oryza sativa Japonica Group]